MGRPYDWADESSVGGLGAPAGRVPRPATRWGPRRQSFGAHDLQARADPERDLECLGNGGEDGPPVVEGMGTLPNSCRAKPGRGQRPEGWQGSGLPSLPGGGRGTSPDRIPSPEPQSGTRRTRSSSRWATGPQIPPKHHRPMGRRKGPWCSRAWVLMPSHARSHRRGWPSAHVPR